MLGASKPIPSKLQHACTRSSDRGGDPVTRLDRVYVTLAIVKLPLGALHPPHHAVCPPRTQYYPCHIQLGLV